MSPDGSTIAFVVTTADLDANQYASRVWLAAANQAFPPVPFTAGAHRESKPRWSPDGSLIAFVDHPEETGCRLLVAPIEGDDSVELIQLPEEIEDLAWSPDGTRLAFTARLRDEARYGPKRDKDRPARHIDRRGYRLDSVGWTIDRPRHVFTIAADGSGQAPTQVTDGPFEHAAVAWSPDGQWLAFSGARTETWDVDQSTHLYRAPAVGGAIEQLTSGTTTHGSPAWSADGASLSFVWGDRASMPRFGQIGVVDVEAKSERLVTTALDRHCAPYLGGARDPMWDSDQIVFQIDEHGNVPLLSIGLDGVASTLLTGDRHVIGFDKAGGTLAAVVSTPTALPELVVVDADGERALTSFGAAFHAAVGVHAPERFVAVSSDGHEVEAWLMRPSGAVSGRRPLLLNIHGGPFAQYGNRFFDEFQLAAGAGYVTIYSNPRGSSGYGEAFARAIRGPAAAEDPGTGWGGIDYDDVMAVVDAGLEQFPDLIDPQRLGVMGGSYGGFMTSWIIGHSDRFKAACSERACNNLLVFAHTSDIGSYFPAAYIGCSHLDDPDEFLRQSPVSYYRAITTPVLILHSESDLRCPIEQAEDLYLRLKMTGQDVEFVRFPGESHELSRSGSPRHRIERMELILDWFARKL